MHDPDLVTLLIGVNDVVRGVHIETLRANVEHILEELLGVLRRERLIVVSVPDYTLTPRGADYGNPNAQRAAVAEANAVMAAAARERGVAFVDISVVANEVPNDNTLVAGDGLHPSGTQYARWVELIAPVARGLFGR